MSPDTLNKANFALQYSAPSPDGAGNAYYNAGYVAVPGSDEIIVVSLSKAQSSDNGGLELIATGYGVGAEAGVRFQTVLANMNSASPPGGIFGPSISLLADGTAAVAWQVAVNDQAGGAQDAYAVLSGSGQTLAAGTLANSTFLTDFLNYQGPPDLYATSTGFTMEWNARSTPDVVRPQAFSYEVQVFDLAGTPGVRTSSTPQPGGGAIAFAPHAFATAPPVSLQLTDNAIQVYDGATFASGATIPGEPAHAITNEAAAMLADGHAAVAWVDSGTAYVTVFDPSNDSFSATTGLDWGGVEEVHLVALPDGGFVVSWTNTLPPFGSPMSMPPRYEGEVFTADGVGGGVMTLSGDVAGIDSHGDLYTVSSLSFVGSQYIVGYAIKGGGIGTPGNDTFNLGRDGGVVTGNGGNDIYNFAEVPWAGGHITDFNVGDVLNLTGLMSTTPDSGMDGFADGYLKIADDGQGNAQVWANYHLPGNDGWWLVETFDGVAPASLTHSGDTITLGLTSCGGATGQTFTSDDNGDTWGGTAGDDVFHLGRGGDTVTGGAGADTFAYAAIPWAGGHITDFNAAEGDKIDVSGLLSQARYGGADPIADGFLKFDAGSGGNARVWADYNIPGNDGWWLVATLDGVSTSSLHYAGGLIT